MGFLDDTLNKVGEEYQGGKGFEAGTHTVTILAAEAAESKDRPIIRVTVGDPADTDKTAEATLWFHTEGGAAMGVAKVMGLLVHNNDEEKKPKIRELGKKLFSSIDDPKKARDVAAKLLSEKLVGKEAYLVVEIDNSKYSTSRYGDLWHYEAKAKNDEINTADDLGGTAENADDLPGFGDV